MSLCQTAELMEIARLYNEDRRQRAEELPQSGLIRSRVLTRRKRMAWTRHMCQASILCFLDEEDALGFPGQSQVG